MKTAYYVIFLLLPLLTQANPNLNSNLFLELTKLPDNSWGVFVIPDNSLLPSEATQTGTGQVTIVAPAGFTYYSFKNYGGTWVENARVTSPKEAKESAYISFGFVADFPKIKLNSNEKTLLFSFITDKRYEGDFHLFENGIDPFEAPNSFGSNPGNDLGIIDKTPNKQLVAYRYNSNLYESNLFSHQVNKLKNKKPEAMVITNKEDEDEE